MATIPLRHVLPARIAVLRLVVPVRLVRLAVVAPVLLEAVEVLFIAVVAVVVKTVHIHFINQTKML